VGEYEYKTREAARLSAHDELRCSFERLVGNLSALDVASGL